MKIYNTPAQARNLREIEIAAMNPVIEHIKDVNGNVQPVCSEEAEKETGPETEAEAPAKKARSKKDKKTI